MPAMTHCLRTTKRAVRTGNSVTSNDFTCAFVAWFHMITLPLYRFASTQGSLGCSSTDL